MKEKGRGWKMIELYYDGNFSLRNNHFWLDEAIISDHVFENST